MLSGRAGTILLAIIGALLIVVSVRYVRPRGSEASASDPAATIRFYKNPVAVADFSATDLEGRLVSSASLKGKVVIVNFWATWCPPCRAEIPDLVALQAKYKDKLQIIGVSEDEGPIEDVKRFAAEHEINYPIVMTTPAIAKLFPGVSALPTSFFLDGESRLVQKHVGMLRADVTELETRALAGLPVNATIAYVDRSEGLKLENGAQLMEIPGVQLASLSAAKRGEALQKLNAESCTCGCDLTVAKCRVDDPNCSISLPLARDIVAGIAGGR